MSTSMLPLAAALLSVTALTACQTMGGKPQAAAPQSVPAIEAETTFAADTEAQQEELVVEESLQQAEVADKTEEMSQAELDASAVELAQITPASGITAQYEAMTPTEIVAEIAPTQDVPSDLLDVYQMALGNRADLLAAKERRDAAEKILPVEKNLAARKKSRMPKKISPCC